MAHQTAFITEPAPAVAAKQIMDWLMRCVPTACTHDLCADSRQIQRGDVFIAVPSVRARAGVDGRAYIEQAVAQGACAVIAESEDGQLPKTGSVPVLRVRGLRGALGALAALFYGAPSEQILSIAVTGTNGKTSCTHWMAQALTDQGTRCALIGTVGAGFVGDMRLEAGLTTPDAIALERMLKRLVLDGAQAVAMEVSSIGLDQGRVNGMKFDIALFTNLTRDHLDYHADMAAYAAAKARLFDWPTLKYAVINLDDPMGERLMDQINARAQPVSVIVTTLQAPVLPLPATMAACLSAHDIRYSASGLSFTVQLDWASAERECHAVQVSLVGEFNVANVLSVFGVLLASGMSLTQAVASSAHWVAPAGRMQCVHVPGAPMAVIDYAHTPDALVKALEALRPLANARTGCLWVVFGAGGDRDPGKRSLMGAAAASADRMVITSDNPRTEDPQTIIEAIAAGVPPEKQAAHMCARIVDRAQAIARALTQAQAEDVVLIAGKGHEHYQDIGGCRVPFSDVAQAKAALDLRCAS